MPLTQDDIDAVADKIVQKIGENPPPFWLKAEDHYDDHKRLRWFFKWWDVAAKTVGHVVIAAALGFILYLFSLGRIKPWP